MSPVKPIDSFITFCYTRDIESTATFYGEVLGLEMVLDQGGCRIYQVAGKAFVGFCNRAGAPEPAGVLLTFVTDDVDGWFARVKAAGATVDKEPVFNPEYQIYHCFVRDPSGYIVEIQRFEDPRWSG